MKPRLPFALAAIVAFLIFSFQLNGQNTSPFWSLVGNSNASATSRLGTTNWMPLRFITNNAERMRVNNGGNVGIGNVNPLQKLDVLGNINIGPGFGLYLGNQKLLSTPGNQNLHLGLLAGENSEINGGFENIFIGLSAGQNNFGPHNTFIGYQSGVNNSGDGNTFSGYKSGNANTSGNYGTFYGNSTGGANTIGSFNTGFGSAALQFIVTGSANCAFGANAGGHTNSNENCFFGHESGSANVNGSRNTMIGAKADANGSAYTNSSCLGYGSMLTASNQVRLGNNTVTSIGGFQPWTNLSDGRFKKNIKENVPGLEFISQLRPVTYTVDMEALDKASNPLVKVKSEAVPQKDAAANAALSKIIRTGFVAQEVEATAKKLHFEFSGVDAPKNDKDFYGLRYSEFVVPLVKAVQELLQKNNDLEERVKELERLLTDKKVPVGFLEQNSPNPFSGTTTIRYSLPDNAFSAKVVLTNVNGQIVRSINLGNGPTGQVEITKGTLAAGSYYFSLWVDGKKMDTRKMILAK